MAKILIVEDDANIAENICDTLRFEKHIVELADNGRSGLLFLKDWHFDLAIIDWNLPEMEGIEIVRQYRRSGGKVPILMLTAKGFIADKEAGFEAGADDYLTKPFEIRELMARVKALLRRAQSSVTETVIESGDLKIDPASFQVFRDGKELKLVPKEFSILELLMRNPNQVFSIDQIFERLWAAEDEASAEIVRTHIKNLRKKLEIEGRQSPVKTIHGVGYRFNPCFENPD